MLTGIHLSHFGVLYDTQFGISATELIRQLGHISDPEGLIGSIRPLTGLIGKNSTGKSALFEALAYLSDCLHHGVPFASTLRQRGGFARLSTFGQHHEIAFDLLLWYEKGKCFLRYSLTLGSDAHHRPYVLSESAERIRPLPEQPPQVQSLLKLVQGKGQILENSKPVSAEITDLKYPALSVYGSIKAYPELCFLSSQLMSWYFCSPENREPGFVSAESGGHRHLNENCDNIRNVLEYYRQEHTDRYSDMISRISSKIPDGKRIDDAFLDGEVTSGSLKLFTYLLLLEDPKPRPLICFEEPDTGLYHDMVDILAFEMRDYTLRNSGCQILFTTHNPYILEALRPEEVWVFERRGRKLSDSGGHQMSQARCIGHDPLVKAMYKQGVGMGSMWYGGHFDREENPDEYKRQEE